jgi:hypothetical protein
MKNSVIGDIIHEARNQLEAGSRQSLAYSSTLKMEAICSSEMLVNFERNTHHYISNDRSLVQKFGHRNCSLEIFSCVWIC